MVTDPIAHHGEGVIWDTSAGKLRWVDMLAGDVLSMAPREHEPDRLDVGAVATAIRPRRAGGLAIALERGFALLDADMEVRRLLGEIWRDPTVRMNDGACDPQGRFYCGSMAYDAAPGRGSLYRLEPDYSVHTVLDDVTISNGLAWSADGDTAYYIDSPTQRVDAFDFDAANGTLRNRRPVVSIDPDDGTPDGMAVDAEGFLWVAMWGGGAVRRYAPDGRLDGIVEVGARQVTACAFGGPNLDELYITTSRQGLAEGEDPGAGALFRCRPGVHGLTLHHFAG